MSEVKWDVFCILCAVRFLRCVCQWGFYFREVCVFGLVCMWLCICRSIDCCVCVRRYKGASGSSAVCAFTMDQVEEAFNGRYREVNRETQQWYTYNHPVPEPRPGAVSLSSLQKLLDGVPQNRSVMWMLGHSKKIHCYHLLTLKSFQICMTLFIQLSTKNIFWRMLVTKEFPFPLNSLNIWTKNTLEVNGNWKTLRFETNEN